MLLGKILPSPECCWSLQESRWCQSPPPPSTAPAAPSCCKAWKVRYCSTKSLTNIEKQKCVFAQPACVTAMQIEFNLSWLTAGLTVFAQCKILQVFVNFCCSKGKSRTNKSLSPTRKPWNYDNAAGSYGLILPVTTFEETRQCLICNICHPMHHGEGVDRYGREERLYRFVTNESRMPTSWCICASTFWIFPEGLMPE